MTTTDNTAVIRQLEREVELLRSEKALYARMIAAALNGKRHPKETKNDGRLNAIRALVAGLELVRDKYRTEQSLRAQAERHCDKLAAELAEMQRLYERATRQAMEAEGRADRLENKNTCKACNGTGYRGAGGDKIGTWPCEHCRPIDAMNQWR